LDAIRARAAGEDLRAEEKHEEESHAQSERLETHTGEIVCDSRKNSGIGLCSHEREYRAELVVKCRKPRTEMLAFMP